DPEVNGYVTDEPGVRLGGKFHIFERVLVHDNGQDGFQASWDNNSKKNFVLKQSWVYNSRPHSFRYGAFNDCSHSDGVHIYEEGAVENIFIEETILGPGLTNGLMLGEIGTWVQNVTLRDVLIIRSSENGINTKTEEQTANFRLERVTLDCSNTRFNCLRLHGSGHRVTDSIIVGAHQEIPNGLVSSSNNCQWDTTGYEVGAEIDPQFAAYNPGDRFGLEDIFLPLELACPGSRVYSVESLFDLPDDRLGISVAELDGVGFTLNFPFLQSD
ncbi:MAG: hypothetical protein AAF633_21310, partial [Chloroflexota bacterium]